MARSRFPCAPLTVMVLTAVCAALSAPGAGATIAWSPVSSEGNYRYAVRVAADDGSGAWEITRRARGFELSPDGATIAYEALGGVMVRGTAPGAAKGRLLRKGATIAATAWAPDGRALALGAGRSVRVVDPRGRVRSSWRVGGRGAITGLAFSPDGRRVAVTLSEHGIGRRSARLVTARRDGRGARRAVTLGQYDAEQPRWGRDAIVVVAGFIDDAEFSNNTTELAVYAVDAGGGAEPAPIAAGGEPVRFLPDGRLVLRAAPQFGPGCLYVPLAARCDAAPAGLMDVGPDGATSLVVAGAEGIRELALVPAGGGAPVPLGTDDQILVAQWRGPAR